MARQKLILTYQDYLKMPDDRTRKEIIGGDLYVTAAPSPLHQRVVVRLVSMLSAYVREHGLGEVLVSPIDVVQPDIIFVAAANAHIVSDAAVQGAPDVVIEVLSPSTLKLDCERKMDLYLERRLQEGHSIQADLFPGLSIDLHDVWS